MEVYFLVIITFIMFIFVLLYDKDLLSPSAMICESFLISLLVLSVNINEWSVNLSMKTIAIILIGNLVFVITSIVYQYMLKKKGNKKIVERKNKPIEIDNINFNILLIFSIIAAVVYVYYFYQSVGGFTNFTELSKAINYYRVSVSYDLGDAREIPTIVTQLIKVIKVFSLISIYIYINNHFYNKQSEIKVENKFRYIVPMLLFIPLSLLTGNRSELSTIIIAIVVMWNFTSMRYGYKLNLKKIQKFGALFIIAILMFSMTKNITGRTSESDGFDYFSIYFGAPIELLDLYVKEPPEKSDMIGKETFWSLNNTLMQLKGEDGYQIHLEVRYINNVKLGNVYTAYRNMYQDFGFFGLIVLQIVVSVIFTKMYVKIKTMRCNGKVSIYELMYALMVHVLLFYSFSEQFFNSVISINYVTLLLLFMVVLFFLTKVRFRKKVE